MVTSDRAGGNCPRGESDRADTVGGAKSVLFGAGCDRRRTFVPGEPVLHQGAPCDGVFYVQSGALKSYYTAANGSELVVDFRFSGELIGLEGLAHDRCEYSVVALERSDLRWISRNKIESLLTRCPEVAAELIAEYGRVLRRAFACRLAVSQSDPDCRLAHFLTDLAVRRGGPWARSVELRLPMSRFDIASYLGVAAETVSRTFTRLKQRGLLKVDGRSIRILDIDRLFDLDGVRDQQSASPSFSTQPRNHRFYEPWSAGGRVMIEAEVEMVV